MINPIYNNPDLPGIRYLIHISDIHIRLYERIEEYDVVFNRLYQKLKEWKKTHQNDSLIVLTGDIIHQKNKYIPITKTYEFLKNLSDILPTILINGNHDVNLSNKTDSDPLASIISIGKELTSLYYLKDRGLYRYQNILFGVWSCLDLRPILKDEIPERPTGEYLIGLMHETINGARLDNNQSADARIKVLDFDGYNYVLLGHIHKHQYLNAKKTIAYAGSLIQQSHGETRENHGYLLWDLETGESQIHEISNDYGYFTLEIQDGKFTKDIKTLSPKPHIRVRVLDKTSKSIVEGLMSEINSEYQVQSYFEDHVDFDEGMVDTEYSYHTICENIGSLDFQKKLYLEYYDNFYSKKQTLIEEELEMVLGSDENCLNKYYNQLIDSDLQNIKYGTQWILKSVRFNNMYCFHDNNGIDFTKFNNKVVGLIGANYTGKSTVLDIILYCLYEKSSRGDRQDVLNNQQKHFLCEIEFEMGEYQYCIERKMSGRKFSAKISYQKRDGTNGEVITGKSDVKRKITELLGTYEEFILTVISLQDSPNNFISMTQAKRKDELNNLLRLNIFEKLHDKVKEEYKNISLIYQQLQKESLQDNLYDYERNISRSEKEIKCKREEISKYKDELDKMEEMKSELMQSDFYNFKLKKTNPKILKERIDQKNKQINYLESELESLLDDLVELNLIDIKLSIDNLNEIKITEIQNKVFIDHQEQVNSINEEIKKKQSQMKPLSVELDELNPYQLRIQKQKISDNLQEFDKEIKQKQQILNNITEELNETNLDEIYTNISKLQNKIKSVSRKSYSKLSKQVLISDFDKAEKELEQVNFSYKIRREELDRLENDLAKLNLLVNEEEISKNYRIWKSWESDRNDLLNERNILNKEITIMLEQQDNLLKLEYDPNCSYCMNNIFVKEARECQSKLKEKQTELSILDRKIDALNNSLESYRLYIKLYEEYIKQNEMSNKLEKEINQNRKQLIQQEQDIYNKEKNITDLEAMIGNYDVEKKIEEYQKVYNIIQEKQKEKNKILETVYEYQNQRSELQSKLSKILENLDMYHLNQEKIKFNQSLKEIIDKLEDQIKSFNKQFKDQLEICSRINEIWRKYLEGQDNMKDLKKTLLDYAEYEKNQEAISLIQSRKKNIEEQILFLSEEQKKFEIDKEIYQKEIDETLSKLKDYIAIEKKLKIYKFYNDATHKDGIMLMVINKILPKLEYLVNCILRSISRFELKCVLNGNNIDMFLQYPDGKRSVDLASGYEKFVLSISLRLAFSKLSNLPKPDFIAIDEGFGRFDCNNLEMSVKILFEYLRKQFNFVLVISHIDQLLNAVDDTLHITVKKGSKNTRHSYINNMSDAEIQYRSVNMNNLKPVSYKPKTSKNLVKVTMTKPLVKKKPLIKKNAS